MPEVIDNIKVGEFIKSLLKKNGMTQEALAQKLMISKSAVSQNLNGKSSFDIQNLMAIAKIFNLTLDDLLNCHISEDTEQFDSEYMRFASKSLEEIKQHNPNDLHIQDPDIYGKVLIDYVIDQDLQELFEYLDSNDVSFVHDYYHRAGDIYIKIIIYMLRRKIKGVIKYIQHYAKINNGFDLTQTYSGMEVWNLLNDPEQASLIQEMIDLKIKQEFTTLKIKRNKMVKAVPKDVWIESIGTYKLNHVLKVFLDNYGEAGDIYSFTQSMLLYEYREGIETFIKRYFEKDISDNARASYHFQKTIKLIINKKDFDLFQTCIKYHIYESLTDVIVNAIYTEQPKFYQYCYKQNDHLVYEQLDFSKIGYAAVKTGDIKILELFKENFDQKTLNYLLSEVPEGNINLLYYLIANGALFDFKYYNSNTMKNTNAIIKYLIDKEVK